jgi:hypothetical protein
MKTIILFILIALGIVPLASAASDCEHTCCDKFSGSWDDDFDDCKHAKTGFDTCVSDCEAQVYANRPQMGDTSGYPTTTVHCCGSAVIIAMVGAAFISSGSKHG